MTNILLLSPFFYPEPISTGKYNTILAKELSLHADSIDVLCSHPIYPKWSVEITSKQLDKVNALRGGKHLVFPKNTLFRRAILEVWYLFFVSIKLLTMKKKYTHIIPVFPPSLFMTFIPLICRKASIIGIVHDLQGVYAKNSSGNIKSLIFKAIKVVESRAFNACDKLIFLSEDMMRVACSDYKIDNNKCFVHYPFITIDKFENNNKLSDILTNESINLVYSGALGEKQAPKKLADFMTYAVTKIPNLKSFIFSQGPEFEYLKQNYPNINFNTLVEENDLPELLLRSSIQIIPQETNTSDGSLPSKLPNLLASKCKILCITDADSELVRILDTYSRSIVTNTWDIKELTNLLEKLIKINQEVETEDSYLLDMFTKEALVNRILY